MLTLPSVPGEGNRPIRQLIIPGHEAPGIAIGTKILSGIKGKRRGVAERADESPLVPRQVSLGAIFDYPQGVLARDCHDCVHVAGLPEKVNRNDAYRAR